MALRATSGWVLALTLLGLAGCSSRPLPASTQAIDRSPGPGETANVVLYLSNQSAARPAVTMSVHVDGELVLRRTMRDVMAGGKHGFPDAFPLCLSPGRHTIHIVAEGLTASATTEVVVGSAPVYVDAAYDYGPEHHGAGAPGEVSLHVGYERPGFC